MHAVEGLMHMTPEHAAYARVFGEDIEEALRLFECHRVEPRAIRWDRMMMQDDEGVPNLVLTKENSRSSHPLVYDLNKTYVCSGDTKF